ncbi:Thioredoxin-like fold containing protein [Trema orientale]|uniref:Thioredoxin-like fold containing protein n=1 Tax=Trema orientale TaxID=63057 RepID=A0A2P5CRD8_TREOI|nr:Thioredoxin-like fold containing protein [Trema orientale]
MMKKAELVVLACCICLAASSSSAAVDSKSDGVGEWQLLTRLNFSSQIRLYPHILLMVTLPWSGESRSLMKEVSSLVTNQQEWFTSLKLMVMYINTEKMLADAIGAMVDEITILYYHNSVSYKYRGRLRAQNILFSIHPYVLVSPGEIPLKSLSTPAELKTFLDSTDRAVLLLEFCGWTPKLLAKGKKNVTENVFGAQGWLKIFWLELFVNLYNFSKVFIFISKHKYRNIVFYIIF